MADDQLVFEHFATGENLYAIFTDRNGQVWATDSSMMETYATVDITDYDVAATEEGTASQRYKLTIPGLPAGLYKAAFYQRAGASPAEGDTFLGSISFEWDGSEIRDFYNTPVPQSYAAQGAEGTEPQILYATQQGVLEFAKSGTILTIYQLDGTTTAFTCTLNNADTPTERKRTV